MRVLESEAMGSCEMSMTKVDKPEQLSLAVVTDGVYSSNICL
jgi:hypothetical protein